MRGSHRLGESGLGRLHRRDIDAYATHAERIEFGEQRIGRVLVHIDDAAAACDAHFAHCVEHAGIVAAIGARLHEHEPLDAEMPCQREIVGKRRERRRVAQRLVYPAMRISLCWPEHVEMGVARQRWRTEGGHSFVRVVQLCFSGDY